jgi:hypothetical protein
MAKKKKILCWGNLAIVCRKTEYLLFFSHFGDFAPKNDTLPAKKKKRQILSIPGDNQDWHVEPGSHFPPSPRLFIAPRVLLFSFP